MKNNVCIFVVLAKVLFLSGSDIHVPNIRGSAISRITLGISARVSASFWHVYSRFDQGS